MDIYDLALAMTPRVGGRTAAYLIEKLFSAENIFSLSFQDLKQKTKLNDRIVESIVKREGFNAAMKEMEHCEKYGIKPISAVDIEYPSLLRETHDPPHVIYVQGETSILTHNLISIVGTRNITNYGDRATDIVVEQLAQKVHNLVIVSGLAFGVDGAAHRAALKHNVPTIAVLPNPLPGVTPSTHSQLASSIIDSGGALITELRSTTNAAGKAYIARNRIIAGMSAATIIVESGVKGGAMSTAKIAMSENRVVAAVPGRIIDGTAMGCNKLIAEKSAIMLNSADDIIRELRWEDRVDPKISEGAKEESDDQMYSFSENQRVVMQQFKSSDPIQIADLGNMTGLPVTQLGVVLMELELMGAVRAIPGARYQSLICGE